MCNPSEMTPRVERDLERGEEDHAEEIQHLLRVVEEGQAEADDESFEAHHDHSAEAIIVVHKEQPASSPQKPLISHSHNPNNLNRNNLTGSTTIAPSAVLRHKVWKLCFGAAGIYVAYLYHGNLEEDLFRYRSATNHQRFHYVWLLQAVECAAALTVGGLGRWWCGSPHPASWHLAGTFALPAVTQLLAKACTNFSLAAGLSFPVVILAKSAKIVPVMLGQLALGGARYSFRDYLFVALIVSGTAMLSSGGERALQSAGAHSSSTPVGLLLIFCSLVMDGGTAGLQKRIKKQPVQPTSYDFLVFTNLSMLFYSVTIAMATDDLFHGRAFLADNPECWTLLFRSCICSAVGQAFIFYVIAVFDPLVLSTVTTTRKILTVLLSVALKGHSLTPRGRWGLALALAGLFVEVDGKVHHHWNQQQVLDGSKSPQNKSINKNNDLVMTCDECSSSSSKKQERMNDGDGDRTNSYPLFPLKSRHTSAR